MTNPGKTRIRAIALALGVLALLAPVTVSQGVVEPNDACAAGLCCPEPGSVCDGNGEFRVDHAYINGVCPNVRP